MAPPGLLRDRQELEVLFDELAIELDRLDQTADIVMVGGAWMLWHSQRAATRDVDSGRRFATDVSEAVERIGARHDLSPDWLNDHAAAYWPAWASFDDCETVYQRGGLMVRAPAADVIFVMKLYRAQPQDREDMITLWPLCTFSTLADAARAFHNAYPHAPEDEHLDEFIEGIAHDAG